MIIINENYKGGKILDVGSSPFHLLYCLKKMECNDTGVDINPSKLKKFYSKYNLTVKKCNVEVEKLPFSDNSFDLVILDQVFEHLIVNPIFTLKEINRVLKHKGVLFLSTNNLYAIHKIFMFFLGRSFNDAYDEFVKLYTCGYTGHIREYSTKEIKKFLHKTNFRVIGIRFETYNYFFNNAQFNVHFKLIGFLVDLLMRINPYWRRHQVVIARKHQSNPCSLLG